MGLGLSIARQLTQLHGGRIEVSSPGESLGSTFTLFLPSLDTRAAPHDDSADARPAFRATELEGIKVLVVDDEDDSRLLVERFLSKWGAQVQTAQSGKEGLDNLKELTYDIVISDIGMPDMNGYDFIKRVRTLNSPMRRVPAAALTAFARVEERSRALDAGYNSHLTKPIEESTLVSEVARLAQRETT